MHRRQTNENRGSPGRRVIKVPMMRYEERQVVEWADEDSDEDPSYDPQDDSDTESDDASGDESDGESSVSEISGETLGSDDTDDSDDSETSGPFGSAGIRELDSLGLRRRVYVDTTTDDSDDSDEESGETPSVAASEDEFENLVYADDGRLKVSRPVRQ